MSEVKINQVDGIDVVQFQPKGVCSKLMQFKVKDGIIEDMEVVGGCSGNLGGISVLVKGLKIEDVITKLQGILCGSRATSCPDQVATALKAYLEAKQTVKA